MEGRYMKRNINWWTFKAIVEALTGISPQLKKLDQRIQELNTFWGFTLGRGLSTFVEFLFMKDITLHNSVYDFPSNLRVPAM